MPELRIVVVLLFLITGTLVKAQVITDFTLADAKGISHTLSEAKDKVAVVIIFTNGSCPFDSYYKDRFTRLVDEYAPKNVQFFLIDASPMDEKSVAGSTDTWFAFKKIPYLTDPQQKVMNELGARKTPEVFILQPASRGFNVVYHGAVDNNPQVASDVKQTYLRSNLEALLAGKPLPYESNRPVGCMIK